MNICDFIPFLKMISFKGIEKSMIELHNARDEFLQNLLNKIRFKRKDLKTSDEEEKRSVAETLLSLQESNPEIYTDEVIKSVILVNNNIPCISPILPYQVFT